MKHFTNITLGSDPEVFVFDTIRNQIISSIGLVGHGKYNPKDLSIPGYKVQEDNVLLEFNTPPVSSKQAFIDSIATGLNLIEEEAIGLNRAIRIQASAFLPETELQHPSANIFGCDPDFDAWKEKVNSPPAPPENGLRTAGGHVHVGWKEANPLKEGMREEINKHIVRWMDLLLGVPSILMDMDKDRRKLYGKAGAYRDKPYGVEYRTLSSFWIDNPKKVGWVWDQTMRAIEEVDNENLLEEQQGVQILKAINTQDFKTVKELVNRYNLQVA